MDWLELHDVRKQFRGHLAVDDVSLGVREGETIAIVGPSGCGKTTALRMIAGFESLTGGEIWLRGRNVSDLPPHKRNIGITFQDYALFPHMTVERNVAFGLRMRRLPKETTREKVATVLSMVRLSGLEDRYPSQLSGGQQQRVALARAIVIEPVLLLLDEPLSNLDAKLREEMRVEIKEIQRRLKITTIFVTHDQEEALTIADRIAVMHAGQIVQVGTPADVFERPQHSFVAGFVGQSNLLQGEARGPMDGCQAVETKSGLVLLGRSDEPLSPGTPVIAVVRKLRVTVQPIEDAAAREHNAFDGRVELVNYLGDYVQYVCTVQDSERIIATAPIENSAAIPTPIGAAVAVSWRPEDCLIMPDAARKSDDGTPQRDA